MENMFNKFTRNHRIDFVSSMLDVGRRCCSKFKCSLDRDANSSSQRKYINAMKRCGILTKVFPRWAHIIQSTSWTVASVNLSRCSFDDPDAHCTCERRSRLPYGTMHSALLSAPQTHFDFELLRNVFDSPSLLWVPHATCALYLQSRARAFLCQTIFEELFRRCNPSENEFVMSIEFRWLHCY